MYLVVGGAWSGGQGRLQKEAAQGEAALTRPRGERTVIRAVFSLLSEKQC